MTEHPRIHPIRWAAVTVVSVLLFAMSTTLPYLVLQASERHAQVVACRRTNKLSHRIVVYVGKLVDHSQGSAAEKSGLKQQTAASFAPEPC
jgi:hypothetical protein